MLKAKKFDAFALVPLQASIRMSLRSHKHPFVSLRSHKQHPQQCGPKVVSIYLCLCIPIRSSSARRVHPRTKNRSSAAGVDL